MANYVLHACSDNIVHNNFNDVDYTLGILLTLLRLHVIAIPVTGEAIHNLNGVLTKNRRPLLVYKNTLPHEVDRPFEEPVFYDG